MAATNMIRMRIAGEDGALEYFLEQYRVKCDQFGDDPHPLILRRIQDAIQSGIAQLDLSLNGSSLLTDQKISDDDVFSLSESLATFPDAPINSIDLSVNAIKNNGAKALGVMLKSTQTLALLNLRSNDIEDVGGLALAHALEGQRTITQLNLNGNPIGDAGMAGLAKTLSRPSCALRDVDWGNTDMGINALIQILRALQSNTSVEMLRIGNPRITTIDDEPSRHISTMLTLNKSLRLLDISKHRIRDQGIDWVLQGLSKNTSLTSLELRCNEIGPGGATLIAQYLGGGRCHLKELGLAGNRLTDLGGQAIALALQSNVTLERLDMSYTSIGELTHLALAKIFSPPCSSTIISLKLWGTHFTPNSGTVWRNAISCASQLEHYDFAPFIQE
uniref:Uncharacterized protein n=1 Tax=Spongospora subterranea TaxID=70186 RepID=A0A0H5QHL5_9EUKA|eukprot:CRZ00801.1 hypothetical protein [Spongospora subterranea]